MRVDAGMRWDFDWQHFTNAASHTTLVAGSDADVRSRHSKDETDHKKDDNGNNKHAGEG